VSFAAMAIRGNAIQRASGNRLMSVRFGSVTANRFSNDFHPHGLHSSLHVAK